MNKSYIGQQKQYSNKRINYTVYEDYRTSHQKRRPCVGEGL